MSAAPAGMVERDGGMCGERRPDHNGELWTTAPLCCPDCGRALGALHWFHGEGRRCEGLYLTKNGEAFLDTALRGAG